MEMRKLSESFISDLKNGVLCSILKRVKQDQTLMLAIRKDYINIYYRGGSLLKLEEEQGKGSYKTFFDDRYNKSEKTIPSLPKDIGNNDDAKEWVDGFPCLKEIMDIHFSNNSKPEREFQQLVARENNYSTISNESEYFISDIEFADPDIAARYDMLAVRWPASERKNGDSCRPVLIEMKYGDGALDGSAGLLEHLRDIDKMISRKDTCELLKETIELQINLLSELELLKFNRSSAVNKIKLDRKHKPEVIFLLANHNPRSAKLNEILGDKEIEEYAHSDKFDLKFFTACFAGYGLHTDCVLPLDKFKKLALLYQGRVS